MISFKSIILFGSDFDFTAEIKDHFKAAPFIKVFETTLPDEMDQIMRQSEQSAIFVQAVDLVPELIKMERIQKRSSRFKIYFLDHQDTFAVEAIRKMSRSQITTLTQPSLLEIQNKLAFYLLGKTEMFNYRNSEAMELERTGERKSYFTHFQLTAGKWDMVASTHEQDQDIETRFDRSWSLFCSGLLKRAGEIFRMEEEPEFSKLYHCLIYPHAKNGKLSLSVIHLRKDQENFQEQRDKAISFLQDL